MRGATVVRELVPAFSAVAYIALARKNWAWWRMEDADRDALKRFAIAVDDRGRVAVPRQGGALRRFAELGFVRVVRRAGFRSEYGLALPKHVGFLVALDARREAFHEKTPPGRRFYELLGYGEQWRRGRAKVAAAVARWTREPRERL